MDDREHSRKKLYPAHWGLVKGLAGPFRYKPFHAKFSRALIPPCLEPSATACNSPRTSAPLRIRTRSLLRASALFLHECPLARSCRSIWKEFCVTTGVGRHWSFSLQEKFIGIFRQHKYDLGFCSIVRHGITYYHRYPSYSLQLGWIAHQIVQPVQAGVLKESRTNWLAKLAFVHKKWRFPDVCELFKTQGRDCSSFPTPKIRDDIGTHRWLRILLEFRPSFSSNECFRSNLELLLKISVISLHSSLLDSKMRPAYSAALLSMCIRVWMTAYVMQGTKEG